MKSESTHQESSVPEFETSEEQIKPKRFTEDQKEVLKEYKKSWAYKNIANQVKLDLEKRKSKLPPWNDLLSLAIERFQQYSKIEAAKHLKNY